MTKPAPPGRTVLRRRSWPVLCAIAGTALGIGMLAAVWKVTSVNGFRTGWQGIPVYLALVAVLGRIATCKVVLREDSLVVVNPLRTHTLPRSAVAKADVDDHGTLELHLLDGDKPVPSFAFGGSLVDRVKGTSEQAARTITAWLNGPGAAPHPAPPRTHWTRSPYGDTALALCAVTAAVGGVWMALGGGA
ncbi:PH domain-containing protein [Streptomyces sp. B93]|uniref:PH domain-containing protein n=1 Tax=Streptomyces sp. B93 TaxID=2824875 RepID=UPI001B35B4FD|nr:PH domain-containing protein [Streptomyces sp. B93]MBQ1091717.1 PH domain-containing protein [Streptomyces sp. B93]